MSSIALKILKWFDKQGRKHLPWQQNPNLYRVWVSEIMLQQTQVSTVIPYYQRFMKKFPELSNLAKAPLDEVLSAWTGLGYYARARNLHKTAEIVQAKYQGELPKDFESLLQLPGIGRSTAGAILALSTRQRHPILDGNVKRVLSRFFMIDGWPSDPKVTAKLWQYSEEVTPKKRVNHYTQAIMDLGAMVCTRTKPKCNACPLAQDCLAKANGVEKDYPMRRPSKTKPMQKTNLIILFQAEKKTVLLEKRPEKGIWGGLWSFPECKEIAELKKSFDSDLNITIQSQILLPAFRHTFTHFHLDIHPILCKVNPKSVKLKDKNKMMTKPTITTTTRSKTKIETTIPKQYYWHPLNTTIKKGLPAPIKRLLEEMRDA